MKPVEEHRQRGKPSVRVGIVTVSDSRTLETDVGGALAEERLRAEGHLVVARRVVRDEPLEVRAEVQRLLAEAEVVITSGGTGIAARDSTYEALAGAFDKTLTGFGELFRALSYAEVGPAAMMSRATAGTMSGGVVLVLPGSPDAVRLALERIVLPELGHLARLGVRTAEPGRAAAPAEAAPAEAAPAPAEAAPSPAASPALTHLDARGHAHMVDVGGKVATMREAVAQAVVTMNRDAFAALASGTAKKGDVLATARIAGIQAAKRTAELIPLCHPIALTRVELELDEPRCAVRVVATAASTDRTGVEMEALVAANLAALTVYDMLKAVDRSMAIGEVVLLRKTGGKSDYAR
jgi:cyclic pyranopterin phosphate synthase